MQANARQKKPARRPAIERLTKSRGEPGLVGILSKRLRVIDKQRQANATLKRVAVVGRVLCRGFTVCGDLDAGRVDSGSNQLIPNELNALFREFQVVVFVTALVGKAVELKPNIGQFVILSSSVLPCNLWFPPWRTSCGWKISEESHTFFGGTIF